MSVVQYTGVQQQTAMSSTNGAWTMALAMQNIATPYCPFYRKSAEVVGRAAGKADCKWRCKKSCVEDVYQENEAGRAELGYCIVPPRKWGRAEPSVGLTAMTHGRQYHPHGPNCDSIDFPPRPGR